MRIVDVKESGLKMKKVGDKTYLWRQKWLNVPKEYRNKPSLIVIAPEEFINILWDKEARKKVIKELDKLLEERKKRWEKKKEERGSREYT